MPSVAIGSASYAGSGSAVAIGNFDGVHAGHRAVLAAAKAFGRVCAYTFDPAPTAVVAPARHQARITTLRDRVTRLGEAGADEVVVEPFTKAWAAHSARWFAEEVLAKRLRAGAVVVGYDFRFGMGREGDVAKLRAWLPDLEVHVVAPFEEGGVPVSSSRIRRLVLAGDVEGAAALLGRPHELVGTVVHGDHRGRTIGFPTANLENEVELVPADGVYAVGAIVDGGEERRGVTNVGLRPTVDGARRTIETHLLGFDGDLYGRELRLRVVARLRDERKFASLAELKEQIARDVAAAEALP
ncbi:MAG: bifunctional riboflavin kinase/FAD synthetase [Myxococcota bacterium]